jgi:hypothetical protein
LSKYWGAAGAPIIASELNDVAPIAPLLDCPRESGLYVDLPARVPAFDVAEGSGGFREWIRLVDDRRELAGFGELLQNDR